MPPILPASDVESLQHLLEAQAVTLHEVVQATGIDTPTLDAVLVGSQPLTREQMGQLTRCFHVAPSVSVVGE